MIEEAPHKHFKRDEDDILFDLTISITEAVLGAELEIPVLGGTVMLKIEPGTQPGKILKLRDKGIRHLNHSGRGDQLVRINIFIPNKISSKDKELFKELSRSESIKPRTGKSGTHNAKDTSGTKSFFNKVKDSFS